MKNLLLSPFGHSHFLTYIEAGQLQMNGRKLQLKFSASSLEAHCSCPIEDGRYCPAAESSTIAVLLPSVTYCQDRIGRNGADVVSRAIVRSSALMVSPVRMVISVFLVYSFMSMLIDIFRDVDHPGHRKVSYMTFDMSVTYNLEKMHDGEQEAHLHEMKSHNETHEVYPGAELAVLLLKESLSVVVMELHLMSSHDPLFRASPQT